MKTPKTITTILFCALTLAGCAREDAVTEVTEPMPDPTIPEPYATLAANGITEWVTVPERPQVIVAGPSWRP